MIPNEEWSWSHFDIPNGIEDIPNDDISNAPKLNVLNGRKRKISQ